MQPLESASTQPEGRVSQADPERFILYKRDKGEIGTELKSLVYVKSVRLGEEALRQGQQQAAGKTAPPAKAAPATQKKPAQT